jgi:DNA polymerase-4
MDILHSKAPLMEQISIDEAFLDISDLPDSSEKIARELQSEIRDRLGLPCSIGVASNKLVAKIATDYGKSQAHGDKPPNAITIVSSGSEAAFLDPLPVVALWGVGPKTAEKLNQLGIRTIGEIARFPAGELAQHFGKNGLDLSIRATGIDDRPLVTFHEPKSISQETTFSRDINDHSQLVATIMKLSERVSKQVQKAGKRGVTVKIKLRWPDFTTLTRQITLLEPTDQVETISRTAIALFENEWKPGQAVRLIGVGISGFEKTSLQLGLWDQASHQKESTKPLDEAVETLRKRFGENAVVRGSQLVQEPPIKKTPR